MSELTKKFQNIMEDIECNITDEKMLEYVNKKVTEISMLHMEVIGELTDIIKNKIANIEITQNSIETKVNKMQTSIEGIENDIYEDDGYDFEIVCPYCNNEFTADIESKSDIKCPECQNIIELDWNGDEHGSCSGNCSSCSSGCGESFVDELDDEINYLSNETDEDDDM